ncbi:hypothetical protein K443DRAFT_635761 [Laccaria amethystina LaAM-08-1]|uniref:Unplaced genomic scaffold K443scaffold_193, whole genome shotgun sequence n=1 Tax=Laccaria amethystina LaAM-08-1 TaxID=1095629 RepID=A0A0C9X4K9_9AGAR|nr:hypothetical protein K443DRAFT_635761 [Laccaria amethystina LaAM-08-1]
MPIANGHAQLFSRILGCHLILNLQEAYYCTISINLAGHYLLFKEECGQPEKFPTPTFSDTDDVVD